MNKLKLYLDTTIWNFVFAVDAPEYQAATVEFFQMVRIGLYEVFYSEAVIEEIEAAPLPRRRLIEKLFQEVSSQKLERRKEIQVLADAYLEQGVLPKRSQADALHVAYSTINQMDALVSWNFRHLANVNRRKRVVALNRQKGYNWDLELVTPLEVLGDEKD